MLERCFKIGDEVRLTSDPMFKDLKYVGGRVSSRESGMTEWRNSSPFPEIGTVYEVTQIESAWQKDGWIHVDIGLGHWINQDCFDATETEAELEQEARRLLGMEE